MNQNERDMRNVRQVSNGRLNEETMQSIVNAVRSVHNSVKNPGKYVSNSSNVRISYNGNLDYKKDYGCSMAPSSTTKQK